MAYPSCRLALALGLTLLAACTANAGHTGPQSKQWHVLVDASRDGGAWWSPQTGPFTADSPHQGQALAGHFRSLGYQVKELPRPTTITPELLAGFDIVVRASGFGAYAAEEIDAYDRWVRSGGRLLLLVEHHPQDALAEHFGLQFRGIARVPGDPRTNTRTRLATFAPHPLTHGVGPLPYLGGSGLTAQPAAASLLGWLSRDAFLDLNDNGVKDPGEPAAPAALGVLPLDQGRIVFCGDANLWEMVPQPLVKNTLSYLTAP